MRRGVTLSIMRIHDNTNHCVEDVLMTYCMYNNIKYIYMYADSWQLNVNKDADDLDSLIDICKEMIPHQKNIKELLGINIWEVNVKNLNSIKKKLDGKKFFMLLYDAFYCHWDKDYNKYHLSHYFFLSNILQNNLVCEDPYLKKSNIHINYEEFLRNKGKVFEINIDAISEQIDIEYIMNILAFYGKNNKKHINFITEKILYEDYLESIALHKDILNSKFMRNITYISNARFNLYKLCIFCAHRSNLYKYKTYAEKFYELGEDWIKIKNKILKYIYKKNDEKIKEDICLNLFDVSEKENRLYKIIISKG